MGPLWREQWCGKPHPIRCQPLIAPDGNSFWLVWADFQRVDGARPRHDLGLQRVEFEKGSTGFTERLQLGEPLSKVRASFSNRLETDGLRDDGARRGFLARVER